MSDAARRAEAADVVMCYRHFLGREPENAAAIESHLRDVPTVEGLIQRFRNSREYEAALIDYGCSAIWRCQDGRGVRVDAGARACDAILEHVRKVWSDYGATDPYYSVLTNPIFRVDNIDDDVKTQFFGSGSDGVANLRFVFERNGLMLDPRWHVLDFGCGLGRIGEHLCREFDQYYGVDISASHLAQARARFKLLNITNANFFLLDESLSSNLSFHIFYSMIVLQHNPPPIMYFLLDQFLQRLSPGGFAFFQLPCRIYGYSFDTDRYLSGEGKRDSMEMHALPQKNVFELLFKHGLRPIEVCPFSAIGRVGISYVFFAYKPTS